MNIFVLHTCPKIAASLHCDQHIGKMILESAQMLSTVASQLFPINFITGNYYKATHEKHPCTLWLQESPRNMKWLIELCYHLDNIRQNMGADPHSSMEIVKQFEYDVGESEHVNGVPINHIFCGPLHLQYNSDLSIPQKYQAFYKLKAKEWESKGREMTWKNRQIPEFMLTS